MFITLQVGRYNVLVIGNNETKNPPYNIMTWNLPLGWSMLKLHCMLCVFVWLIDVDGDLALINPTKPFIRGEFGQDLKEGCKENLRPILKPVAPVPSPSLPLRY